MKETDTEDPAAGVDANVIEHFRECPGVEPADDCPSHSVTKRLKSCAANTLEKGELCLTGGSCPAQEVTVIPV